LASQVRREERLGGGVAVDEDCVVAYRADQDVGDWTDDRDRDLPEQDCRAVNYKLAWVYMYRVETTVWACYPPLCGAASGALSPRCLTCPPPGS
jgi:hypothetical protein